MCLVFCFRCECLSVLTFTILGDYAPYTRVSRKCTRGTVRSKSVFAHPQGEAGTVKGSGATAETVPNRETARTRPRAHENGQESNKQARNPRPSKCKS